MSSAIGTKGSTMPMRLLSQRELSCWRRRDRTSSGSPSVRSEPPPTPRAWRNSGAGPRSNQSLVRLRSSPNRHPRSGRRQGRPMAGVVRRGRSGGRPPVRGDRVVDPADPSDTADAAAPTPGWTSRSGRPTRLRRSASLELAITPMLTSRSLAVTSTTNRPALAERGRRW